MTFFDAHLDLAYLAECGRDMTSADLATCGGPHPPAAVTFPSLREGRVTACLGTIFTQGVPDPHAANASTGHHTYPLGDSEAAHRAGLRQLDLYHKWERQGRVALMPRRGHARASTPPLDTGATPEGRDPGETRPSFSDPTTPHHPLRVGILMECADPIRSPDELPFWSDRGVVAIGLAWAHGSRYAAGNAADPSDPTAGLTDVGRSLVRAMDRYGLVHDLSHLSQRATDQLFELTDAPVIASHSNCRALFDRDPYPNARQRHLADETIKEIVRRGGVIGINLFSDFLDPELPKGQQARIDDVVRHVEHIAALVGHTRAIGLGTDMDGGFSADRLPSGVRRPADLERVLGAIEARGLVQPGDLSGIAHANWVRFWDQPGLA